MPEPMQPEDEARLMRALADVADHVNDGLHPDGAIEKAARAHDVPCGHVPLLVNAYNIGRTTRQREEGRTVAEKAADFPLATTAHVLERLFPAVVKSAVAAARESRVSPEYFSPPTWYTRPRERDGMVEALEKVALATPPPTTPPATKRGSDDWHARHALANCDRRARGVAAARLSVTSLEDRLMAKLAALADGFRAAGGLTVADVRDNVAALHGAAGTAVLDHVVRTRPALAKAASTRPYHAVSYGPGPYRAIAEVLDASRELADARERHDAISTEAAEKDAAELAALRPPPPRRPGVLDDDGEKAADFRTGLGYAMGTEAVKAVGHGLEPPEPDRAVEKTLARIATPEHEQMLAEIEARAHLHELLNHDSVLRGHDPHEVARHYNRISEFAPSVSRKPLMAVPLVRKSVQQGQLDTFDAKEVADAERTLRTLHHGHGQHPTPGGQKHAARSVLD